MKIEDTSLYQYFRPGLSSTYGEDPLKKGFTLSLTSSGIELRNYIAKCRFFHKQHVQFTGPECLGIAKYYYRSQEDEATAEICIEALLMGETSEEKETTIHWNLSLMHKTSEDSALGEDIDKLKALVVNAFMLKIFEECKKLFVYLREPFPLQAALYIPANLKG